MREREKERERVSERERERVSERERERVSVRERERERSDPLLRGGGEGRRGQGADGGARTCYREQDG